MEVPERASQREPWEEIRVRKQAEIDELQQRSRGMIASMAAATSLQAVGSESGDVLGPAPLWSLWRGGKERPRHSSESEVQELTDQDCGPFQALSATASEELMQELRGKYLQEVAEEARSCRDRLETEQRTLAEEKAKLRFSAQRAQRNLREEAEKQQRYHAEEIVTVSKLEGELREAKAKISDMRNLSSTRARQEGRAKQEVAELRKGLHRAEEARENDICALRNEHDQTKLELRATIPKHETELDAIRSSCTSKLITAEEERARAEQQARLTELAVIDCQEKLKYAAETSQAERDTVQSLNEKLAVESLSCEESAVLAETIGYMEAHVLGEARDAAQREGELLQAETQKARCMQQEFVNELLAHTESAASIQELLSELRSERVEHETLAERQQDAVAERLGAVHENCVLAQQLRNQERKYFVACLRQEEQEQEATVQLEKEVEDLRAAEGTLAERVDAFREERQQQESGIERRLALLQERCEGLEEAQVQLLNRRAEDAEQQLPIMLDQAVLKDGEAEHLKLANDRDNAECALQISSMQAQMFALRLDRTEQICTEQRSQLGQEEERRAHLLQELSALRRCIATRQEQEKLEATRLQEAGEKALEYLPSDFSKKLRGHAHAAVQQGGRAAFEGIAGIHMVPNSQVTMNEHISQHVRILEALTAMAEASTGHEAPVEKPSFISASASGELAQAGRREEHLAELARSLAAVQREVSNVRQENRELLAQRQVQEEVLCRFQELEAQQARKMPPTRSEDETATTARGNTSNSSPKAARPARGSASALVGKDAARLHASEAFKQTRVLEAEVRQAEAQAQRLKRDMAEQKASHEAEAKRLRDELRGASCARRARSMVERSTEVETRRAAPQTELGQYRCHAIGRSDSTSTHSMSAAAPAAPAINKENALATASGPRQARASSLEVPSGGPGFTLGCGCCSKGADNVELGVARMESASQKELEAVVAPVVCATPRQSVSAVPAFACDPELGEAFQEAEELCDGNAHEKALLAFQALLGKVEARGDCSANTTCLEAEAWAYIGVALQSLGRVIEAIEAYKSAVSKDPCLHVCHANLASLLSYNRNHPNAIAHIDLALRLDPSNRSYEELSVKIRKSAQSK